ncbi:unnamed protein product [Closterium sp. NIES-54]
MQQLIFDAARHRTIGTIGTAGGTPLIGHVLSLPTRLPAPSRPPYLLPHSPAETIPPSLPPTPPPRLPPPTSVYK